MTDRPILFQPPMVRALLADLKTNSRRILKAEAPPEATSAGTIFSTETGHSNTWTWLSGDPRDADTWEFLGDFRVPYKIGDMLWVREAWRTFVSIDKVAPRDLLNGKRGAGVRYEADGMTLGIAKDGKRYMGVADADRTAYGRVRASMHMPRWASRLTLVVTDVRVERLKDVSIEDALAEGVVGRLASDFAAIERLGDLERWRDWIARRAYLYEHPNPNADAFNELTDNPRVAYCWLWDEINGPGSWDTNPWVVALTFTVEKAG